VTSAERRLLKRNLLLGLVVTILVACADHAQCLRPIENGCYDLRSKHFQHFAPPPTDRLVHLDIDDATIKAIGGWPWPRKEFAQIIDEVHHAGAKALALDVIFIEPEPTVFRDNAQELAAATNGGPLTRPSGAADPASEGDTALARALDRFGNSVVPVSLALGKPPAPSPEHAALLTILQKDLEISQADANAALRVMGFSQASSDEFNAAQAEAMWARIEIESQLGPVSYLSLRDKLLPRGSALFGDAFPAARTLKGQFDKFEASEAVKGMGRARFNLPVLQSRDELYTIPQLARSATSTGFVDFIPYSDGVVRSMPLVVQDPRGRLTPQLGLALACAYLGIAPNDVEVFPDRVILRPGPSPIVIPTQEQWTASFGDVGCLMNIPMAGTGEWLTMYDYPAHAKPTQHLPVVSVWDACQSRERLRKNNAVADTDLPFFFKHFQLDESRAKAFQVKRWDMDDVESRTRLIQATLKDEFFKVSIDSYNAMPASTLTQDDRDMIDCIRVLQQLAVENPRLKAQFEQQERKLHDALAGRAVIVGWTAEGRVDFVTTPLHARCPGVVIHGAIFNAILTGWYWRQAPQWVTLCITLAMGILTTIAVALLGPWKALGCTLLLVFGYFAFNASVLFDHGHWIVGAAGPIVAGASVWPVVTLRRYIGEAAERGRITRRFRNYVDPSLVKWVLEHPDHVHFEGERREMTMAFSDLVGFTSLTEKLGEATVKLLSEYVGLMVPQIRAQRGFVAKLMGDGIFFFFGAPEPDPDHAAHAVSSMFGMRSALGKLNEDLKKRQLPQLGMRIGVSTGHVIIGDAGTPECSDYTALGDSVNLAARLESANKAVGTLDLISDSTKELLGGKFVVRPIAKLRVVGKSGGVMTYEPLGPADRPDPGWAELVEYSRNVVDAYQSARFEDCLKALDAFDHKFGPSKWSELYRGMCDVLKADPPADFDGTISLDHK
jgi:class 3 adenylate cyclase/CHASE2 domain-containing sensor protein